LLTDKSLVKLSGVRTDEMVRGMLPRVNGCGWAK